ncbi:Fip1 motif-domain-containing protein [Apiospora aurea]|uniref:Fip1 motif-domain-containing protein n=1 Tax=Apiospora aurea TaxID=335848 RepID=A0ABR1QGC1_9PEZI
MDIDDDDDFYAPDEPETTQSPAQPAAGTTAPADEQQNQDEDLEEGEEEDEGAEMDEDDDSDIDIITERKDGTKAPPPASARYSDIRNIPQRTTSTDGASKPVLKKEDANKSVSGADLPAVATSKIDVNAIPIHKATGKPITQVNIDEDLPENDKPWRKPGTDLSDYFNYGFDEFTWAMYAAKQENVRGEYSQDVIAANNKKMMEDMQMMMMGGMPSGGSSMPSMPGMDGMAPDMQQMMQQMMASGMDPSQMDPAAMSAMFSGMQPGGGNAGGGQGQGQNFGGTGPGFGNNQGQDFGGYNQGMGGGGGRGGGGGGFGRGRGGRRW